MENTTAHIFYGLLFGDYMLYKTLTECNGCILATDIIDDNERLILKQGITLDNRLIERLKNFGIYAIGVEDPISDGIDINQPVSNKTVIEACRAIDNTCGSIDVDKAFQSAGKLVKELCDNSAILSNGFHILKAYDENTSLHSVNVAIIAVTLGINLGLNITRLNNLGVGAVLHDIGKSNIPIEILNKADKLTDEEMAEMRKHPQYGWDILNEDILVPATVKAIAHQHHENWDGTGYPRNLCQHQVYELAAIVHICDVFDALVSKRAYKEAFSFYDTIEYMKSQSGKMFSPYYLNYFFKYVPIFHTGTVVTLNTGDSAIVVRNNIGDMTRPLIRLYKDSTEINLVEHQELFINS